MAPMRAILAASLLLFPCACGAPAETASDSPHPRTGGTGPATATAPPRLMLQLGGRSFDGHATGSSVALGEDFLVVAAALQGEVAIGPRTVRGGAAIRGAPRPDLPFGAFAKIASDGTVRWVRTPEGACVGTDLRIDVAVDDDGNVYMAGASLRDSGMQCVCKYDTEGELLWGRQYPGVAGVASFDVSADGHVVLATKGPPSATTAATGGEETAFVTVVSPDGGVLWTRGVPARVSKVAFTSAGGVVLAGTLLGSWTAGNDMLEVGAGGERAFLAALSMRGEYRWALPIHDGLEERPPLDLDDHPDGSIVLAGQFRGTLRIGSTPTNLSSGGTYLARVSPAGELEWVRRICAGCSIQDVAAGAGGRVLVAGEPRRGAFFGVEPEVAIGCTRQIVARLDRDGEPLETQSLESCLDASEEQVRRMTSIPVLNLVRLATTRDGRAFAAAGTFAGVLQMQGIGQMRSVSRQVTAVEPFDRAGDTFVEPVEYQNLVHAYAGIFFTGAL